MPTENITKENLKELRKEIAEDMQVYIGALYEKFQGDVQLLAEQQTNIHRDVKEIKTKVSNLEKKTDMVFDMTGSAKEEITQLKEDHKILEKRVLRLEATV